MERMVATLSVSTRPVAVRSTDRLGVADSQTKRNTGDVGREGKKKGLERKEIRPADGDEVSAAGWRRTERAGGVAPGRIEAGGDRAGELGRHRSTVSRELKRNAAPYDGWYRARRAQQRAHARRYRSRRNSQFGLGHSARVEGLLREEWSPEQVAGHLRLKRELSKSKADV